MGIFVRVNRTWKEIEQPYTKANGQIKATDVYTKVDGKPRLVFGKLKAEDIIGFLMVYYKKEDAEYPDLPDLKYNPNLPVIMTTTVGADLLNFNNKGVIYEYFDTNVDQEGILMYDGRLLAMLKNGMVLDIFGNPDLIPGLDAPLITKAMDFTIVVSYDVRYQGYGHHTRGWNSMWSSHDFLKSDSEDEEVFELDVRPTAGHVLVPSGDTNSCKEWRAMGLKNLSYERALEMVTETLHLPDGTDMSKYAAKTYSEPDIQCPGRRNTYISYERSLELWNIVLANRDVEYNDGLFKRMCQNVGIGSESEIPCTIYGECTLGYLTYRAALGESDCQYLAEMNWPSMSLKHTNELMNSARDHSRLTPDTTADEIFDPEPIYCPGRDVAPISYQTAFTLMTKVMSKISQTFDDELSDVIMDELGIDTSDQECSFYGTCVYDNVSFNQALYWRSCESADVSIGNDIIPEDTSPTCEIGIARSMHVKDHHMNGSRGAMSQNIYSITLDGIEMPFRLQII